MSKINIPLFGIMLTTILSMTLGLQSANAEPVTMDINKLKIQVLDLVPKK